MSGPARLTTGHPGLDAVLDGGLPAHAIHLVFGAPGTGKTVFAEQLVFANATRERPAVYLTTLSEPFAKTLGYLQGFAFFDPERLGTAVHYEDVGPLLAAEGPERLLGTIERLLTTRRPAILVVDSFKAVQDLQPSLPERRRWLYRLAGLLSAYRVTTLWLGEYGPEDLVTQPEFAVADGSLEFVRLPAGLREARYLRVHKLRGSGFRSGAHAVTISGSGLAVWPRVVTPPLPPAYAPVRERLATGVPGLDALVEAGFWRGSTTLVAGPSGSGKTALALHFALEGARRGEPSLFVHLQENPTQLAQILAGFGEDPAALAASGALAFLYQSPVELQVDAFMHQVFARLDATGARRLVVDALGDLAAACGDPQRFRDYLYAAVQHCAVRNIACLLTLETSNLLGTDRLSADGGLSSVCDNIILLDLQIGGRTERRLRVLKTRGSAHDPTERRLTITREGLRVE
ncbi:MAG TPA: ATPase domain-containing protein [Thermodesulfobacteriota bacterium]|nr:ATPase domain-containing protein [Thermodesulfobacteriota bacterium]